MMEGVTIVARESLQLCLPDGRDLCDVFSVFPFNSAAE